MMKKNYDVLSCIQPSGEMHLGNYFGAVKNWVKLQDTHNCIYGIVDLHAMTKDYDPKKLKEHTDRMVIDLLACGIDPMKSILFVQSLVPEHTELAWIFNTLTGFGELTRQTQFKDQQSKTENITAGFFTYPVLQAADILIYNAKVVPVGEDQRQHLELTRNIAQRFNNRFQKDYFNIPETLVTKTPRIMSLADPNKKMSKSLGEKHYIRLFAEEKEVIKKVKTAITDSGNTKEGEMSKGVKNLFELLDACEKTEDITNLMNDFTAGQLKYSHLKEAVTSAILELTKGLREKRNMIEQDTFLINDTIREMSHEARKIARDRLYEVKKLVGIKSISHF